MSDDRKRIPVDTEYVNALGLAVYTFARLEWQVAWCSEKIKPGALQKITSEELTAGKIAKHFANLVRNMPKSGARNELSELAKEFTYLVDQRNEIVHGKPCTAPDGKQRLSSRSIIEISKLEHAADSFVRCGGKLNAMFYGFLQEYVPG
ncbi:hypothetical protein [Salinisphaera aquimarina]|uniref:RiboL-PSP-HEPN domain-containing protein n=1 Tax=Salinisphaera aquimarina TaxID=2094031 RepID=A0ABV7EMS7_9GAMM